MVTEAKQNFLFEEMALQASTLPKFTAQLSFCFAPARYMTPSPECLGRATLPGNQQNLLSACCLQGP